MIRCIVDGKEVFPNISQEIKVTRENPYVKNKDSWSMDINFPMSIPENIEVFRSMHRQDVSKRNTLYEDCLLYADNILVIRGSGRLTEITQDTVKVQIVSGISNVRYRSDFEKIFIDRIDNYPLVDARFRFNHSYMETVPASEMVFVGPEILSQGYVGNKYQYVFQPTYDTNNDIIANAVFACVDPRSTHVGPFDACLLNVAVQPNLMMVLHCVLEYMGYTIKENVFNVSPWNELIIANVRQTNRIAYALPHWSVARFLDEVRKLFNASYIFDETTKEVSIVPFNELDQRGDVSYELVEEYKTNYDEDGIEYLPASNIQYDLQGGDRTLEDVPAELLRYFPVLTYPTYTDLLNAFDSMSEQDRFTHIFKCENMGLNFYGHKYDQNEQDTGEFELKPFGFFGPLYRDIDSETFVKLSIAPAFMYKRVYKWNYMAKGAGADYYVRGYAEGYDRPMILPNVDNPEGNEFVDYDEKGYVSVSNVLEDGDSGDAEETEEEVLMTLMWVDEYLYIGPDDHTVYGNPTSTVDWRNGYQKKPFSLALDNAGLQQYIGNYHRGNLELIPGVDGNNEIIYSFLCEGIPDPTVVYRFRGKRYLCSKIEIKITDDGIDPLKTGYFYEIAS